MSPALMEGLREESRFLGDAAILMGGKKKWY
jgi:hypothetical protein